MIFIGHLTSFALLLQGTGNDGCGSDNDYFLSWLSLAFVSLAIICIIIAVGIIEIFYRYKTLRKRQTLNEIKNSTPIT